MGNLERSESEYCMRECEYCESGEKYALLPAKPFIVSEKVEDGRWEDPDNYRINWIPARYEEREHLIHPDKHPASGYIGIRCKKDSNG